MKNHIEKRLEENINCDTSGGAFLAGRGFLSVGYCSVNLPAAHGIFVSSRKSTPPDQWASTCGVMVKHK